MISALEANKKPPSGGFFMAEWVTLCCLQPFFSAYEFFEIDVIQVSVSTLVEGNIEAQRFHCARAEAGFQQQN
ncbi:MAG: hypothetical protein ACREPB_07965 [Arenimonas sp.]